MTHTSGAMPPSCLVVPKVASGAVKGWLGTTSIRAGLSPGRQCRLFTRMTLTVPTLILICIPGRLSSPGNKLCGWLVRCVGWVVLVLHSFYEWSRLLTQDSRQEALLTIHRLLLMKLLNQCWKSNEDQNTTYVLKTVKVNILHTVRPMKCSDIVDNLFAKEWNAVSLFTHWTISFTKRPGDDLL